MDETQVVKEVHDQYSIRLPLKPCVVKYIESFGGFVAGTYDLFPTIDSFKTKLSNLGDDELQARYKFINQRLGSLIFFCPSRLENNRFQIRDVFECDNGGVFDFSFLDEKIYVAHANGHISRYGFNTSFISFDTIQITESTDTLLTSIDTCSYIKSEDLSRIILAVAGDSQGHIFVAECFSNQGLSHCAERCKVTECGDPVWQVKFLPTHNGLDTSHKYILVAAEDSTWYIYRLDVKDKGMQLTYKNQDFQAGVTSVCFLPQPSSSRSEVHLLLGSYDEFIRFYRAGFTSAGELLEVVSAERKCMVIKGGGIWRLNRINRTTLYVAAMYAGTYRVYLNDPVDRDCQLELRCDKICVSKAMEKIGNTNEPLHYGVDVSLQDSVVCIADFNNSCCIFVDQPSSVYDSQQ